MLYLSEITKNEFAYLLSLLLLIFRITAIIYINVLRKLQYIF